eukprot:9305939-Ditylum_brightwellii.AAC.2
MCRRKVGGHTPKYIYCSWRKGGDCFCTGYPMPRERDLPVTMCSLEALNIISILAVPPNHFNLSCNICAVKCLPV